MSDHTERKYVLWSPARTQLLREMLAQGRSFGQIANRLGGVSRSAVAGKASRLRKEMNGEQQ